MRFVVVPCGIATKRKAPQRNATDVNAPSIFNVFNYCGAATHPVWMDLYHFDTSIIQCLNSCTRESKKSLLFLSLLFFMPRYSVSMDSEITNKEKKNYNGCNGLAGSERALKWDRVPPLQCYGHLLEQVGGLSLSSPVMFVVRLPISLTSSTAWWCQVPAGSMTTG